MKTALAIPASSFPPLKKSRRESPSNSPFFKGGAPPPSRGTPLPPGEPTARRGKRCTLAILLILLLIPGVAVAQDDVGKVLYDKYCSHCHGYEGDGEGVAASRLKPLPRDFTSGKYKVRTTPSGFVPTDDDIKNAIVRGLPYSSMPAFTNFNAAELDSLVVYLKAFAPDFEDPEAYYKDPETQNDAIEIPTPPAYDPENAKVRGRQVWEETGCARCHGDVGRGDGNSAPTLVDDWGNHIRIADLTMPWTFRGGGSRSDIFRTMATGFNGTPMPGFHGALPPEDIWAITDYMVSLSDDIAAAGEPEAPYENLLRSVPYDDDIDIERGAELFAGAPKAMFPIFGQIVEPGRNFYPSSYAVTAQAIHNDDEIAIRITWNDMRAETSGSNGPDIQVPRWDEHLAEIGAGSSAGGTPGRHVSD